MYLYFDREGTLKEIINDIPARVGSSSWNKIYAYFEGFDDYTITNATVWYNKPDNTHTIEYNYNNHYVGSTALEIPFDKKRDLLFFEYFKKYEFYEFNVPDVVLALTGAVGINISFSTATQVLQMGGAAIQVNGTSSFLPEEHIDIAQWNELKKLYSSTIGNYILKTGSNDISGSLTPRNNNTIDLGTSSYKWRNIYAGGVQTESLIVNGEASFNDVVEFDDAVAIANNQLTVQGHNILNEINSKQPTLVSGTNIKTVNNASLLGSGNISVQPTLVSGTNIKTINGSSILSSGNISLEPRDTTILKQANIINNTSSTSTIYPLSANMGKVLNDRINNIDARGRYLTTWNATTGKPSDLPTDIATNTYTYHTGDYFIVSVGGLKMPIGTSIPAGTTIATFPSVDGTELSSANDTILFNGSTWTLLKGTEITVSFSSIAGQPSDNSNLAAALNSKQNTLTAGNNISISGNTISATDTTYTAGDGISISNGVITNTRSSATWGNIVGNIENQIDLKEKLDEKPNYVQDYFITSTIYADSISSENIVTAYEDETAITISGYSDNSFIQLKDINQNNVSPIVYASKLFTDSFQPYDVITEISNKQNSLTQTQLDAVNSGITSSKVSTYDGYSTTIAGKQDTLTAGSNIQINNNVISATDTTYSAGAGIDITNGVISNTRISAEWGNITGTLSSQTDLNNALSGKQDSLGFTPENVANKKQTVDTSSTTDYLSAKAVADFVNSSINALAAFYITKNANGDPFSTRAELFSATTFYSGGIIITPSRNDYCIVLTDENHDGNTTRYIYSNGWEFQYVFNYQFTQAQTNALNSGINTTLVSNIQTNNAKVSNVQSDWNASSGLAQILNKPTIPTVPTNVSAFTNDSNYQNATQVQSAISGKIDTAGTGLSKSGTTLNHSNSITAQTTQALYPIKFDAQGHITGYGTAQTIPTQTSQLTNNSGFITSSYHDSSKQNTLSTSQLNACNSGITSSKVSTYDGYATTKQNTLTAGTGISISNDTISVVNGVYFVEI